MAKEVAEDCVGQRQAIRMCAHGIPSFTIQKNLYLLIFDVELSMQIAFT